LQRDRDPAATRMRPMPNSRQARSRIGGATASCTGCGGQARRAPIRHGDPLEAVGPRQSLAFPQVESTVAASAAAPHPSGPELTPSLPLPLQRGRLDSHERELRFGRPSSAPTEGRHTPACAGRGGSARLTAHQTPSSSAAVVSDRYRGSAASRALQQSTSVGRCSFGLPPSDRLADDGLVRVYET
jgi:hypothetical protein